MLVALACVSVTVSVHTPSDVAASVAVSPSLTKERNGWAGRYTPVKGAAACGWQSTCSSGDVRRCCHPVYHSSAGKSISGHMHGTVALALSLTRRSHAHHTMNGLSAACIHCSNRSRCKLQGQISPLTEVLGKSAIAKSEKMVCIMFGASMPASAELAALMVVLRAGRPRWLACVRVTCRQQIMVGIQDGQPCYGQNERHLHTCTPGRLQDHASGNSPMLCAPSRLDSHSSC